MSHDKVIPNLNTPSQKKKKKKNSLPPACLSNRAPFLDSSKSRHHPQPITPPLPSPPLSLPPLAGPCCYHLRRVLLPAHVALERSPVHFHPPPRPGICPVSALHCVNAVRHVALYCPDGTPTRRFLQFRQSL